MTNEEVTKIRDDNWDWMKRSEGLVGAYISTDSQGGSALIIMCSGMDLRDYLNIQSKLDCLVMAEHVGELKSFVYDLTEEEIANYETSGQLLDNRDK